MKNLSALLVICLIFLACGSGENDQTAANTQPKKEEVKASPQGVGPITSVSLHTPLNAEMVAKGKTIYEMKCAACHKLTDQRVVGPGWKGISERRTPEWIMNMTLNVEEMLLKDPEAKEMLKQCLVRMPNQNLTETDSRDILEFMFANDGQEVGS